MQNRVGPRREVVAGIGSVLGDSSQGQLQDISLGQVDLDRDRWGARFEDRCAEELFAVGHDHERDCSPGTGRRVQSDPATEAIEYLAGCENKVEGKRRAHAEARLDLRTLFGKSQGMQTPVGVHGLVAVSYTHLRAHETDS